MKILTKKMFKPELVVVLLGLLLSPWALADGAHQHGKHDSNDSGHMMDQQPMGRHMREVMGTGRINKIMKDKGMLNISHEPIGELNWPKMRMNFMTSEQVTLDDLKLGDEVTFTLQVDENNNYLIKKIEKAN